jgi:hypothetical protein
MKAGLTLRFWEEEGKHVIFWPSRRFKESTNKSCPTEKNPPNGLEISGKKRVFDSRKKTAFGCVCR